MKQLLLFLLCALSLAACSVFRSGKTSDSTTPETYSTTTARAGMASTGNAQADYVEKFKNAAVSEMQRAGIPASITLAQGILESAAGQSELASTANNHFGIKCGGNWSGKTYHKKDDDRDILTGELIESCFRKYENPDESFFDHSEFLRDPRKSNRYGFLFNLDKRDYKNWARGLQSSGYATSQTYANQLIDLIERLRLYEYDQPGGADIKPGGVVPITVPPQQRIGRVNDVKVVNSREGETLADIARIYKLKGDKVADYNDRAYAPGQSIPTGTRVFIQKKRDSWHGQATHHFVRDKQTILDISQLYGIRLDKLLQRNGLQAGQEPAANEKVRLRGKREKNENIRLRNETDDPSDPTPATPVAPSPGNMAADNNVLFEIGPDTIKSNQPGAPATTPAMPGKPATTGVPYPPDPVPSTTTNTPGSVPPVFQPYPPSTPAKPTTPQTTPGTPAGGPYHTVVKGDTLYNISRRYNTTVARIKQMNNMADDYIQIGQVLRIQ